MSCQTAVCFLKVLVWGLFLFCEIISLSDTRHFLKVNGSHEDSVSISDSANKNFGGFFSFHKRPSVPQPSYALWQLLTVSRAFQEGHYLLMGVLWGLEAYATASCRPTEVFESRDCQEHVQEGCINRDGYRDGISHMPLFWAAAVLTEIPFVN